MEAKESVDDVDITFYNISSHPKWQFWLHLDNEEGFFHYF